MPFRVAEVEVMLVAEPVVIEYEPAEEELDDLELDWDELDLLDDCLKQTLGL